MQAGQEIKRSPNERRSRRKTFKEERRSTGIE